jgi:hypothetical protein
MRERAVIRTAYPTLREAADTYGVSAKKLRQLVARFAPMLDGSADEPLPAADSARGSVRKKTRIRLHVAARRRGSKSKK